MRALIVTEDHKLEIRELPVPEVREYEALVKIRRCGICSTTDRELIKGAQPFNSDYPCVLGHEAVGEVIEVGTKVKTFKPGDLVTCPVCIWPGESRDGLASAWGGFAEYGIVRDRVAMMQDSDSSLSDDYTALRQNLVPEGISIEQAVLAISLSETASWLWHLPKFGGKTVCIAGTGIAGLSITLWSKLAGAKEVIVIGRRKERIGLACDIGANSGIKVSEDDLVEKLKQLSHGKGVDIFIDAVGKKEMINLGLSLIADGGTVAIYGVTPEQKYDLMWGCGPLNATICQFPTEERLAYRWVVDLMQRGIIQHDKLMTHKWPLADYEAAFMEINAGNVVKGMFFMPP